MKTVNYLAMIAAAILTLSGCAVTHGTSPRGLELPIEKTAIKFSADVRDGGYKIVDTDELKKWLDEGKKPLVISTLPLSEDKDYGIVPTAVNAEIPRFEKELTQTYKDSLLKAAGTDKDKTIVVYCRYVACRRSHIGAKILVENGFNSVYRYPAGQVGWQEAGYQLVK